MAVIASYQQGVPIEIQDTFYLDDVPTNPTVVTYTILQPDGSTLVFTNTDPEVTNPSVGSFVLSLDPPAFAGHYVYDVDATGMVTASRQGEFDVIANVATGSGVTWATVGPCAPWVSAQSVWECCGQPMTTIGEGSDATECPVDMTTFAYEASQLLFELSGRQYAGQCSTTVRPPCDPCWCGYQVLSRGYVVGPWSWAGSGWGGWWDSLCDACLVACNPSLVKLAGYPVREITEVLLDGVALATSEYRLFNDRYVMRLNDGRWPWQQDLTLPDTEDGTWSVSYTYGADPPLAGVAAAQQLGCELYKACSNQECALPSGVTRVSRQGITIEKPSFVGWAYTQSRYARGGRAAGWSTGLTLVDAFLNAYNPSGFQRKPVFWAPGHRKYAQAWG